MFTIIRRFVAVILIDNGAVFFRCHRLFPFQCHNILVHLFEDVQLITHYDKVIRMTSIVCHPDEISLRMTYCTGIDSIGSHISLSFLINGPL